MLQIMFSRNPDHELAKGVDGTRSVTQWAWKLFKCPPLNPPPAFRYLSETAVAVPRPGESHAGCSFADCYQFLSGRGVGAQRRTRCRRGSCPCGLELQRETKMSPVVLAVSGAKEGAPGWGRA